MMNFNLRILEKAKSYKAQVLVVTKYFSASETQKIYENLKNKKNIFGLGENRIEDIVKKNLPRNFCHYIGKLQSRKLKKITKYCSVVHSLESLKHAEKLNIMLEEKKIFLGIFIQINISGEGQKGGIEASEVENFLKKLEKFKFLKVLGFSGMGSFRLETKEDLKNKIQEFQKLINIREQYLPDGKISAGTSVDFEIALKEGIDVVRVGRKCFNL